jgi:hypothetical protein
MALGEADVMARQDEVRQFFAWDRAGPATRHLQRAPAGALDLELP